MQARTVSVFALTVTLLVAGCTGTPTPGTPTPDTSMPDTPTARSTATTPPGTPGRTPTTTPAPLQSLPSPARCLTDAAPRPEPVDGVEASTYPEPPANTIRAAVVGWVRSFEIAYFRNLILAGAGDDDTNLTSVSASAEVRGAIRTADGYTVRLSDFGASNYASGIHGDHWSDVGYVVTETHLMRVPLSDGSDDIEAGAGTPVVDCR